MQRTIYPIGTQFMSGGKHPQKCVVTDILKTYNNSGDLVSVRYIATHQFIGQTVTDRDVVGTSIARRLINS